MKSPAVRTVLIVGGILAMVAMIALGVLMYQIRNPTIPDFLSVPSPNGYELLLTAAKQLEVDSPWEVTNNLGGFVGYHERMFADFDEALQHPAEAPERSYDAGSMDVMELVALKYLGYALRVKANHARQEGRWADAANIYLDTMRLGQKVEHGPLMNFLVGSIIELMSLENFPEILPKLSLAELEQFSASIQKLNESRIELDEVIRRERYFLVTNSTNLFQNLRYRFSGKMSRMFGAAEERYLDTSAQTEILVATMAAVRYMRQEKKAPRGLDDLIPIYLESLPRDPYTGEPLLFRSSATNLVVYSAGPNRQDDSGEKDDVTLKHEDKVGWRITMEALSNAI